MPLETPVGRNKYRGMTKTFRQTYNVEFEKIQITPNWNIRTLFDGIEELATDIQQHGLLEPLTGDFDENGNFHIQDGERRYRAIKLLQQQGVVFESIECRVLNSQTTMPEKFIMMMSSGIHKRDYTPCEYADGVKRLKEEFGISNSEISDKLCKSRQWVDMMLKLALAPDEVREQINKGELSYVAWVNSNRTKREKKEPEVRQQPMGPDDCQDGQIGTGEGEANEGVEIPDTTEPPAPPENTEQPPLLNKGDVIVPAKDPSLIDETAGIIGTSPKAQYGDRPLDTQGLESQMLAESKMDEPDNDKVRDEELEFLFKRIIKNTNWIESIGKHLSGATAADLDTRLGWIRGDVSEIKQQLKTKLKR